MVPRPAVEGLEFMRIREVLGQFRATHPARVPVPMELVALTSAPGRQSCAKHDAISADSVRMSSISFGSGVDCDPQGSGFSVGSSESGETIMTSRAPCPRYAALVQLHSPPTRLDWLVEMPTHDPLNRGPVPILSTRSWDVLGSELRGDALKTRAPLAHTNDAFL